MNAAMTRTLLQCTWWAVACGLCCARVAGAQELPAEESFPGPSAAPIAVIIAPGTDGTADERPVFAAVPFPTPTADGSLPVAPDHPLPSLDASSEPPTEGSLSGGGGRSMGGLGGGPGEALGVTYRSTWYPDQPVSGQAARLGFLRQEFSAGIPVWFHGRDVVLATAAIRNETFGPSSAVLDSGRAFPAELWDVKMGTTYVHPMDNGWLSTASISVGSASDRPFYSTREMTASGMGMLRVPHGQRNAWLFFLVYSTNSQVLYNLPIPGVAYAWKAGEQWEGVVGIPFAAIKYAATERLKFDIFYALLTTVRAYAVYQLSPQWQWRSGFDWLNESYLRAQREEDRLRFNYDEKRLVTDLRWQLSRPWTVDLQGGWAFDRRWFESTDFRLSDRNRIDVGSTLFVSLEGAYRF